MPCRRKPASLYRHFNSSAEVIRLVVMMYERFPLSLRNIEDLLFERVVEICRETVRLRWSRFGPTSDVGGWRMHVYISRRGQRA